MDAAGTAYIAWNGPSAVLRFCRLPRSATACDPTAAASIAAPGSGSSGRPFVVVSGSRVVVVQQRYRPGALTAEFQSEPTASTWVTQKRHAGISRDIFGTRPSITTAHSTQKPLRRAASGTRPRGFEPLTFGFVEDRFEGDHRRSRAERAGYADVPPPVRQPWRSVIDALAGAARWANPTSSAAEL